MVGVAGVRSLTFCCLGCEDGHGRAGGEDLESAHAEGGSDQLSVQENVDGEEQLADLVLAGDNEAESAEEEGTDGDDLEAQLVDAHHFRPSGLPIPPPPAAAFALAGVQLSGKRDCVSCRCVHCVIFPASVSETKVDPRALPKRFWSLTLALASASAQDPAKDKIRLTYGNRVFATYPIVSLTCSQLARKPSRCKSSSDASRHCGTGR
jgi:hypothetical protein